LVVAVLLRPAWPAGQTLASRALDEPIAYTVRIDRPDTQTALVTMAVPTAGRPAVDLMMAVWSPGFYRVEDYAGNVQEISARAAGGRVLAIAPAGKSRWRVEAQGEPRVLVSYRLSCRQRSVTTNWVSPDLVVLNGAATFMTIAGEMERPHEVVLELAPTHPRVATALDPVPGVEGRRFRAPDFDTLVDSPIVAGDLDLREFTAVGRLHVLADAGDRDGWDGGRAAADLARLVRAVAQYWGGLPYPRYVFLNVFRSGGGGLEHANSTLLTANAARASTPEGYQRWLAFVAHEYFHAFNVKRLRPVELGPFDYENPPRTKCLWLSEGGTTYIAHLLLARAGLTGRAAFLAGMSTSIRQLQQSPGRLVQTLEQSSWDVWTNSMSGVNPNATTVSYYVKGAVVAFLLDARIRRATGGARSLDDVMRLAYERYAGARGFTPEEFRATAEEVAGTDLREWFRKALASTEELDYTEALDWYGLRFAAPAAPEGAPTWSLEARDDATAAQRTNLAALLSER
jgi:predicted metalloprotease with PDZ domain